MGAVGHKRNLVSGLFSMNGWSIQVTDQRAMEVIHRLHKLGMGEQVEPRRVKPGEALEAMTSVIR